MCILRKTFSFPIRSRVAEAGYLCFLLFCFFQSTLFILLPYLPVFFFLLRVFPLCVPPARLSCNLHWVGLVPSKTSLCATINPTINQARVVRGKCKEHGELEIRRFEDEAARPNG